MKSTYQISIQWKLILVLLFSFSFLYSQNAASLKAQQSGGSWEVYPDPQTNAVYGVHQHKDIIYRAGWYSLFMWDGMEWQTFGGGIIGESARDLISYPFGFNSDSVLVIGGNFIQAGSIAARSIAYWDGQNFGTYGTGIEGEIVALTVYKGDIIAGGMFEEAGANTVNNIARWDGTEWLPLGNGVYDIVPGSVDGITDMAVWNDKLYVVGDFTHAGDNVQVNYVACWNDTVWSDVGGGMTLIGEPITGMRGCAVHNNMLVVVGAFDLAGTTDAINVAGWDGTSWHAFPPGPDPIGGFLNLRQAAHTVMSYNNLLYVGADFTNTAGPAAEALAVWKNNQWQALDGGLYGGDLFGPVIYDMMVVPGEDDNKSLLMGGLFEFANNMATDNMAKYTTQSIIIGLEKPAENELSAFRLYPNPAQNTIYIEAVDAAIKNASILLSNMNGQELIRRSIKDLETEINISHLPAGIYLVKVWNDNEVLVQKLIKE